MELRASKDAGEHDALLLARQGLPALFDLQPPQGRRIQTEAAGGEAEGEGGMRREELLLKGAAMLQQDAIDEQASCAVGDKEWACPDCKKQRDGKCQAQRNVEERRQVAAGLIVLAKAST